MGFAELNPLSSSWALLIAIKILCIVGVSYGLYKIRKHKIAWIVPAFAGLPVIWNVANIVMEIL